MRRALTAVLLLVVALSAGCTARPGSEVPRARASTPAPPGSPEPAVKSPAGAGAKGVPRASATIPAGDPYVRLARAMHARHVQIWFEADLVKAWLGGPASFEAAVSRLGALGSVPGVVGFKIADEIGYDDGLASPAQATEFLRAARSALSVAAPGRLLLVDAVVPDLGCLPWIGPAGQVCADQARHDYPAATSTAVTSYLDEHLIDRLDLSTGLLDQSTYVGWGLTIAAAQAQVWQRVRALGWQDRTTLQSRKALAEAGGYQGSASDATADVKTYIDVPTSAGARAVDVWTWRQPYDNQTVSLLGPGLRPNPLWKAMRREHDAGVHLITHMTPSAMPTATAAFARECDVAAQVFDEVFVAAGTG
jgi:hypothetical protein